MSLGFLSEGLRYTLDFSHRAGHVDNLYHFLWSKDPETGKTCEGIVLAHTGVFRRGHFIAWYHTTALNPAARLVRRPAGQLTAQHFAEALIDGYRRLGNRCGIVAYVVTTEENNSGEPFTYIEYLDKAAVLAMGDGSRPVPYSGTVQQFLEPKGNYNSTIRCTLQARTFSCERRDSVHKLGERRISYELRGGTHEGAVHNSIPVPFLNKLFIDRLRRLCESIMRHVAFTSPQEYTVSDIVINVKRLRNDEFAFLYASSLTVESTINKIGIPSDVWAMAMSFRDDRHASTLAAAEAARDPQRSYPVARKPNQKRADFTACPVCTLPVEKRLMYSVSYKAIIAHAINAWARAKTTVFLSRLSAGSAQLRHNPESYASSKPSQSRNIIPKALQRLEPQLTEDEFRQAREDTAFVARQASVCEGCCLDVTEAELQALGKAPHSFVSDEALREKEARRSRRELSSLFSEISRYHGDLVSGLGARPKRHGRRAHRKAASAPPPGEAQSPAPTAAAAGALMDASLHSLPSLDSATAVVPLSSPPLRPLSSSSSPSSLSSLSCEEASDASGETARTLPFVDDATPPPAAARRAATTEPPAGRALPPFVRAGLRGRRLAPLAPAVSAAAPVDANAVASTGSSGSSGGGGGGGGGGSCSTNNIAAAPPAAGASSAAALAPPAPGARRLSLAHLTASPAMLAAARQHALAEQRRPTAHVAFADSPSVSTSAYASDDDDDDGGGAEGSSCRVRGRGR